MKNLFRVTLLALSFVTLSFVSFEKKEINVVIDAGHGGTDFGATHNEALEKNIVAEITKKIQAMNTNADVKIHITRADDTFMSLAERVTFINTIKPDLVVSLHANMNKNVTTNGIECYVPENTATAEKSRVLAEKLLVSFSEKTPLKSRGVKNAPLMILKKSEVPAITVELGFISNAKDKAYLTDAEKQTEIAQIILDFITQIKE